ncbi:RsfA family transcriptional regulator [Bacillus sp. SM2101]|uniref:RsfA family transcriptional regulator n=1 Tax=Bacillaceae TaxID=186817 RepID=UPI001BDE94C3|nr:RsfA family transcriptional regulator [Bacillus sp. SM2101]
MKERQDAWTEEDDLLLAETILRHVREGSTQLNAFEEVGDKLNRTSAACGFRWNAVVRNNYQKALELARKQRKQRQRSLGKHQQVKKTLLYKPTVPSIKDLNINAIESNKDVTLDQVVSFLQSLQQNTSNIDFLRKENERLRQENEEMSKQNKTFSENISKLQQSSISIQEDYDTLMKIMNRARKLVLIEEEQSPATAFKMDKNGNLEKMAK